MMSEGQGRAWPGGARPHRTETPLQQRKRPVNPFGSLERFGKSDQTGPGARGIRAVLRRLISAYA